MHPPAGGRRIGRHPRQGGGAGARVRSCRAGRPFAGPPRAQPHKALALDSVIWYSTCNSNTNIPDVSVARRDTHGRSQSLRGSEERVRRVRSASFTVFIPTKNSVFLNTLVLYCRREHAQRKPAHTYSTSHVSAQARTAPNWHTPGPCIYGAWIAIRPQTPSRYSR